MKNLILYIETCSNTLPSIVHKHMTRELGEAPPLHMINRICEYIRKKLEHTVIFNPSELEDVGEIKIDIYDK